MSDGPSIQNHRITMTCFRTCSTCRSRSQAPLCHCTRRPVSNQAEGTIARLRYFLGGDRPSQTTHQTVSQIPDDGTWLDTRNQQGGISPLPPPNLAARLQRLPPILHSQSLVSLSSCSKGSRGLSVLLRVNCIGTAISISLSPSSETVRKSLLHSCRSELTRQGISLP